jgi:hypothetical protein
MPRRATSLSNTAALTINRDIDSKYDAVKAVSLKLNEIELVANTDMTVLLESLNAALDFSGITVVGGEVASWDPATKILTVPTLQGEQGIQGSAGTNGTDGADGQNGLTPIIHFQVDSEGNLQYNVKYVEGASQDPGGVVWEW